MQEKPNDFAVVEWIRPNGKHIEAISVKKLAIDGGQAKVGANVQMQYKGEIWKGEILSLHGKTQNLTFIATKFCFQ